MWEDEINQVVKSNMNYQKSFIENEYIFLFQEEPVNYIPPHPIP